MKVLITTDWYKPVVNGVVTSVVNLANGLVTLGHEVKILTLSGDKHSHAEGNVTYIGSIGVGKIYPNARLKTAPSRKHIQRLIAWHPDVVHSQCEFSTFFLAKKIAEKCNCPLLHTYHTIYEDFTHYFSPSVRLGKYMAGLFSKKLLEKTACVIVPTRKIETLLHRYRVTAPIAVVPSGLDLEQFKRKIDATERSAMRERFGITESDKVLLYLGRLAKEKNIEELLHLLSHIKSSKIKLLLVGDGPHRMQLEHLTVELGIEKRTIFAGMVPPGEVASYYALGDVFVSCSQSETQGLTYIEAMAGGLPLLCRNDPCLDEVLESGINGLTFDAEQDFMAKLQKLLTDDIFRHSVGTKARETVLSRFSATAFAASVLCEYGNLLQNAERTCICVA